MGFYCESPTIASGIEHVYYSVITLKQPGLESDSFSVQSLTPLGHSRYGDKFLGIRSLKRECIPRGVKARRCLRTICAVVEFQRQGRRR